MSKKLETNKGDGTTTSTVIRRARVSDIVVDKDKFRDLDEKTVSDLAESFQQVGLMHLPTVCNKAPSDESSDLERLDLVAGRHRLAAAQKLGWEFIDVIVVKRVARKNQMRRISENLHRNGLSKHEEGREIRSWLELRFDKESGQVAQSNDKGISEAAKHFKKSRRTIKRLIEAGAIKPDAAMALKEAGLDNNGQVLSEVSHADPEQQVSTVAEIVKRKTRQPKATESEEENAQAINTRDGDFEMLKHAWAEASEFVAAWNSASRLGRELFIKEVLRTAPPSSPAPTEKDEDNE